MKVATIFLTVLLTLVDTPGTRVESAASIVLDMSATTDAGKRIPDDLFQRAAAVAVFTGDGKGIVSERIADGHWGAPVFIQATTRTGVASAPLVFLFMTGDALRTLEEGTGLVIGSDVSAMPGPIGSEAKVSADAAVYAYSRENGSFAGITVGDLKIETDDAANQQVYGADGTARKIFLSETLRTNTTVKPFMDALEKLTTKKNITQR